MYNLAMLRKELREHRWALIVGTILLTAMGIVSVWSFKMISMFGDISKYLGPELAKEFDLMLGDFTYYVWSQWQPKNLLQIGTILALILAASPLAGEVNRGSIRYLTSLPISRSRILVSKTMAGMLILSVSIWISTLITTFTAYLLEPSLLWGKLLLATVLINLGLLGVYSVGLVFSALSNDSVKAGALAAAFLFVWSATGLHPSTRMISPFWHMKGVFWFLDTQSFPWVSVLVLVALICAAMFAANRIFSKKEF